VHVFVTSDVHLGSPHCRRESFLAFVRWLPDGSTLVLNGDTVDNPKPPPSPKDRDVVMALAATSKRIEVVWVEGNHDRDYRPAQAGQIRFAESYSLADGRLFAAHGSYFDNIMPTHRWFVKTFKILHRLRLRLGASPVHVAEYAKRWRWFYGYLRRTVMANAVEHARENGYQAVTCGHVHHIEDSTLDGIRYVNTGAWTEDPAWFLEVTDESMELKEWRGHGPETRAYCCE